MEVAELIKVGHLNKTFGLKGHIRAFIEPGFVKRLKKPEVIFLMQQNKPLPYFPDETDITESGHGMFHFENVNDKTTADTLVRKEIFVEEKFLKKIKPYQVPADFVGFTLIDETVGGLGNLDSIVELPQHELGQFTYKGKEILFPWNDQVVQKINTRKKEILVKLPEGLLDIYLEK